MDATLELVRKIGIATLISFIGYMLWGALGSNPVAFVVHAVAGAMSGVKLGPVAFLGGPLAYAAFWYLMPHTGGDGDLAFMLAFFCAIAFSVMTLVSAAAHWVYCYFRGDS